MQTKIQKWGNSLGLRVPKSLAQEVGVEAGSGVDISVEDGDLIIRPARLPKYELKELLDGMTARNIREEVETGHPRGREVW